ncbi:hypothetical protein AMECASPLE_025455 [Ameca splendens]|uniref:THAP-type domain-containing protein n=1 Tax=Ameca splendens TaxID=208324 RepID=A0ABV0Y4M7_9TELE
MIFTRFLFQNFVGVCERASKCHAFSITSPLLLQRNKNITFGSLGGSPAHLRVTDGAKDSLLLASLLIMPHSPRSCIFPGCYKVPGSSLVTKFQRDDHLNKLWTDFVKRSHNGDIRITTNTCLCTAHFSPDSHPP